MGDEHEKSLHEELLGAFLRSVRTEAEVAAANEIERLRAENEALKRELGAGKVEKKKAPKADA